MGLDDLMIHDGVGGGTKYQNKYQPKYENENETETETRLRKLLTHAYFSYAR